MRPGLKFERTRVRCYIRAVKISIVVPAFNEERLLGGSLAQIKVGGGRVHAARLGF